MAVEATNHHLPDLVVHQILQLLPTKSAVRMSFLSKQWEGMWSSSPVLDFDEGDDDNNNINRQDKKSIRHTLTRYLKLNEKKSENKPALDKFKLRFTRYSSRDADLVTKLLSFLCSRGVKELDISLGSFSALQADSRWNADMRYYRKMMQKRDYDKAECYSLSTSAWNARDKSRVRNYYYLPRMTIHNNSAKYITSLNLGYVRLKRFNSNGQYHMSSLKSMSINMVHFDRGSLPDLITRCPFVEHLSFSACSFEQQKEHIIIQGSTLKSLQVEHCEAHCIEVEQAVNLESLVIVSDKICWLILQKCFNLRHINISASDLEYIDLDEGEHHNDVKGTIEAPVLHMFEPPYLMSKISVRAPNLTNMPGRNEYRLYEIVIG